MFRDVFQLRDLAVERGDSSAELDEALETAISNIEENLNADVERSAVAPLDAPRRGDATVLQSAKTNVDFARFLGCSTCAHPRWPPGC